MASGYHTGWRGSRHRTPCSRGDIRISPPGGAGGGSLGDLCGKLKKTHTRRGTKQHRLVASETKRLPTSLFEEASAGSPGWRGVLEDSAPSGEELPGDGDWNTAREGHSENLRAHEHPAAVGRGRVERRRPNTTNNHFCGEKTSLQEETPTVHKRPGFFELSFKFPPCFQRNP